MTFTAISSAIFSFADAGEMPSLRVLGAVGFGQAGGQSKGNVRVEGPIAIAAALDYAWNPRLSLGAEHMRSFGAGSTAVGLTGVSLRWYLYTPQPQMLKNPSDQIEKSYLLQKNYVPYLGTVFGFAQGSFPATATKEEVLVVAPYFSMKGGIEYPVVGRWGLRGEANYAMTLGGKGGAEVINVILGIYYFL